MSHWLLKTEPATFGIDHLAALPQRTSPWDGVRNYQARNFLRDQAQRGEQAFIYHSSCALPGIVGIVSVVRAAYPDASAFDRRHKHFDSGSDPATPRWFVIDVQLQRRLKRVITLDELRTHATDQLRGMRLLQRGNRLSVMPVDDAHWEFILSLE
ncbi:MAG TPA: EVE domain-containing protein [Steroidobacteraceae bacterium]